ncbi:hypothetical protein IV417_05730 [Alphaproteobacteria bacterium KMM 3653]|uniref:Uncharacterized protein n=1 Tax=Harenicola maris TaxID=2841044 RepID=A0AAP2G738_9RHOB|nr:hypothetical protein [Harenicola maris]
MRPGLIAGVAGGVLALIALLIGSLYAALFGMASLLVLVFPKTVEGDLTYVTVQELLDSDDSGAPFHGLIIRDSHYESGGQSGWFFLDTDRPEHLTLTYGGRNPTGTGPGWKTFGGSAEKSCGGTGAPHKSIRAIQLGGQGMGYTGRSVCRRVRMDLEALIAAATPVEIIRTPVETPAEAQNLLEQISADPTLRPLNAPPQPYTWNVTRSFDMPALWALPRQDISDPYIRPDDENLLAALPHLAKIQGLRVTVSEHSRNGAGGAVNLSTQDNAFVAVEGLNIWRPIVTLICAPETTEYCLTAKAEDFRPWINPLRDPNTLNTALQTARPLPDVPQTLLTEAELRDSAITAHPPAIPQVTISYLQEAPRP